jgi:protein O-mannosyl-transferase
MFNLGRKPVHIVLIVAAGLMLYLNTLHVPFMFDGVLQIVNVPLVKNFFYFTHPGLTKTIPGYEGFISRYFGYLTFALNYHFNGLNVVGYHLVNICIHLTAALLVYRLVSLTFRTPTLSGKNDQGDSETRAGFTALLAALLFVAHPIQTQAVTYMVQRFASLAAMLYLLSMTCYIRARIAMYEPGRRIFTAGSWFAAALLSALMAFKTKEISYTLPLTVVLYELMFFTENFRKKVFALGLTILAGCGAVFCFLLSGRSVGQLLGYLDQAARLDSSMSRWDYLATECRVIVTYLRLLIFPAGQRMDYDYPVFHSFLNPEVLLSGILLCSLLTAAIYCLYLSRRCSGPHAGNAAYLRITAFGIFWFFITLSIESSIIPIIDVIFEHRMYLPSVGLFMAAAALVSLAGGTGRLIPGWPRTPILAGTAIAILLLAGTTFARNRLWSDPVSFWQDNAAKSPRKGRVFHNLGLALERSGNLEGAMQAYRTASDLCPDPSEPMASLGLIYIKMNRLSEAEEVSRAALTLDPHAIGPHNNIGIVYGIIGRYEEALKEFYQEVKNSPNRAETHNNIGFVYTQQKRYPEAFQEYETCLALDPGYVQAYINRGKTYLAINRQTEAIADFIRALKINPSNEEAAEQLKLAQEPRTQPDIVR